MPAARCAPVVIAHDYLTQRGGAERVVMAMTRAFPSAPIVTSVFNPSRTYGEFSESEVRTTALQRVPLLAKHHRLGLPLYAPFFSATTVDAQLVLCSTSGWAHGIQTTGLKALYVYNTARWVYQPDEYFKGRYAASHALARPLASPLRRWNHRAALTADKVWVISRAVQERVWRHWALDSEVLYPPHGADPCGSQEAVKGLQPGYLLAVTRMLHYKRVDVLLETMRQLPGHQLVVVGDGPEIRRLRASAPRNCRFLGSVRDEELRWLYANCLGLVSAANEDLGLVPLEAMAFGRPVAVLRRGGFVETVVEEKTGVFFDEPTPDSVAAAVRTLSESRWSTEELTSWANRFSEQSFIDRLKAGVRELTGRVELAREAS